MAGKDKLPSVKWPKTGIVGSVNRQQECHALIHVTDVENAIAIVRRESIKPYPEREEGNALYCKPIEVVWLSPTEYGDSFFGCVAFYFDWSVLQEEYGEYIYGLPEVEGSGKYRQSTWKSRILFSHTDHEEHFRECYDPTKDGIPWKTHEGRHFIKSGCDCHIGITQHISLRHLHHICFVNHTSFSGGARNVITGQHQAEFSFLTRAVSEHLPRLNGFCGVDPPTKRPYNQLLYIWHSLWLGIWQNKKFDYEGSVTQKSKVAPALARGFLEQYGRMWEGNDERRDCFKDDAKNIASLFTSKKHLILSLRRVIADWAGVTPASLNYPEEDWPPWKSDETRGAGG